MILRVESITVGHNQKILIEDLSFSLNQGDIAVITGDNGSGKTSLLRSLVGAIAMLAGEVFVADGYHLTYLSPQYTGLYLSLTARQNLSLYTKNPSEQIERFKLPHPDLPCKNLSLGQKTMVSLAISLANKSNILLIDEAMNSLDAENQATALALIQEHTAPAVLVSHRQVYKDLETDPLLIEL